VFGSEDGTNFKSLATKTFNAEDYQGEAAETVKLDTPGAKYRYLKLVVKHHGSIPKGEAGAGSPAWIFVDEIIVE
jgi:hexosaminidase